MVGEEVKQSISAFDAALKKLGLGISSWVEVRESRSEDHFYFTYDELQCTKIGGKWGLAIRTRSGNEAGDIEEWSFNEAPGLLRVRAVVKLPDLLEKLIKAAADVTDKVAKQADAVDLLTVALAEAAEPSPAGKQPAKAQYSEITP